MATRNVSLDLLRIISMFMILILHSVVFMKHPENLSVGSCLFLDFETVVCHSGVNLFVLITGFFLSGTSVRWDKIRNLILTVIFFNFLMLIPKFALLGGGILKI